MESLEDKFSKIAAKASAVAGNFWAFAIASGVVLVWIITGPLFHFSDTWQLVINTGTTIVTFLVVFLIQHSQNKEMRAIQLKLNEIIAAVQGASNRLIDIEDLSDHELDSLYAKYQELAKSAEHLSRGAKTSVESDAGGKKKK